jgi:hypothetical protein
VKRSRRVQLVLLTGLTAGALAGCDSGSPGSVSTENVYTNNHHIPGSGYYHAPFRAWYALPYNHFDPQKNQYFFGGQWATAPHASIINISAPTPAAVTQVAATRTDIQRGGFGSTSRSRSTWS